jgi:predicted aspartyl protease
LNVFNQIIVPDEEEGAIDGRSYRFLFDTGTGRTSVAYDDYTATLEAVEKRESSGAIAKQSNDLIVVPRLEVGSIVAENVTLARMAKGQPNVRNFLGMDMLKELACHFLFDENRILIVASTDLDASENLQPLSLDKANQSLS